MQTLCPSYHPVQQNIHVDQIHLPRLIKITKSVNNLCRGNKSDKNNVIMYLNHSGFQFLGSFTNQLLSFMVPENKLDLLILKTNFNINFVYVKNIGTMRQKRLC